MNFDLDTNDYTKDDYMDIFNLDKSMNPSKDTVEKNYKNLLNNVNEGNLELDEKTKMKTFLTECKKNLLTILKSQKDNYKLINSDFIPTLNQSETYQNNSHFLIKKGYRIIGVTRNKSSKNLLFSKLS